jgi:hypothetical protein
MKGTNLGRTKRYIMMNDRAQAMLGAARMSVRGYMMSKCVILVGRVGWRRGGALKRTRLTEINTENLYQT